MFPNINDIVKTLVDTAKAGKVYLIDQNSYRQELIDHFCRLDTDDRYLRFGHICDDDFITKYVNTYIKAEDRVIAIFDSSGQIIASIHLAQDMKDPDGYEFGLSVNKEHRRKGYSSKMFETGIRIVKALGGKRIYTYCLGENKVMQSLAKKHNLAVVLEYGDATGTIDIGERMPAEVMSDLFQFLTTNQIKIVDKVIHEWVVANLEYYDLVGKIFKK